MEVSFLSLGAGGAFFALVAFFTPGFCFLIGLRTAAIVADLVTVPGLRAGAARNTEASLLGFDSTFDAVFFAFAEDGVLHDTAVFAFRAEVVVEREALLVDFVPEEGLGVEEMSLTADAIGTP